MEPTGIKIKPARKDFVLKCGGLLAMIMPNLEMCRLELGKDIPSVDTGNGVQRVLPDMEYVVVTFKDNITHLIPVEGNSYVAIAEAIFSEIEQASLLESWDGDARQTRIDFVVKCGEVLHIAKLNLLGCELKLGKDIPVKHVKDEYAAIDRDKEYILITCDNGYTYTLEAENKSLISIAADIFAKMTFK